MFHLEASLLNYLTSCIVYAASICLLPPKLIDIDLVVNFELPESVLKRKLLGRRVCADCARGYNVASIIEGDLNMPPLLPEEGDCAQCNGKPDLVTRADDTDEIVTDRYDNKRATTTAMEYQAMGMRLYEGCRGA